MKKIFILGCLFVMLANVSFAQEVNVMQELLSAQQQARQAAEELKQKGHHLDNLLTVIAGGTVAGLGVFAVKKLISYTSIKEEARGYMGLYLQQSSLARNGSYLAGELSPKNFRLLEKLLKNWKKQYVYEVPVVFSDPWGRKFFVIDDVFYKEFLEEARILWEKNLSSLVLTEKTRLRTLRGLGDLTWDCIGKFNEDMAAAMSKEGPLSFYVKEFSTLKEAEIFAAGRKNFTAGILKYRGQGKPAKFKILGKAFLKKVVVLAGVLALWDTASATAAESAERQQIMSRMDANPAILLQATEQDLNTIARDSELAARFLGACALAEEINSLSEQELEVLSEQAQEYQNRQQRFMQQRLKHDLHQIVNY